MKRHLIWVFLLTLLYGELYSIFATVNNWNTPLYSGIETDEVVDITFPGMIVSASKKTEKDRVMVLYNGKKGWMKRKEITFYEDKFSSFKSTPQFITNTPEGDFYFYYDGKIAKFLLEDKKIVKRQFIGEVQQIFPSGIDGIFLLEGVTTNENEEIHHLKLYNFKSEKVVYLGSFEERFIQIERIKFLEDSRYVALFLKVRGKDAICIYSMNDGKMISVSTNAKGVFSFNGILFFYNKDAIWLHKPKEHTELVNYSKEKEFLPIKKIWLINGHLIYKLYGENLYIKTKDRLISINLITKEITPLPYKSLEINESANLCYYTDDGMKYINDLTTSRIYNLPLNVNFEGFVGTNILVSKDFGRIKSYFLTTIDGTELYRYKAIDNINFITRDGRAVECKLEKNLWNIVIEDPLKKKFYPIFLYLGRE